MFWICLNINYMGVRSLLDLKIKCLLLLAETEHSYWVTFLITTHSVIKLCRITFTDNIPDNGTWQADEKTITTTP
jgi:hypothetical protein